MTSWDDAIEQWRVWARRAGYPSTTVRTRWDQLRYLAKSIGTAGPAGVGVDLLGDWFATREWSAETRRSRRTTYVGFWRWAIANDVCRTNPAVELPRCKPAPPNPHPTPRHVVQAGLAAADADERLMVRLAVEAGLRRAEVAQVHPRRDMVEDLEGWSLVVHGKGGRERVVPLTDALAAALRARGEGFAFPGQVDGHLSAQWVGIKVARLLPGGWTMHSLRHRFATLAYDVEHDVFVVQELLGHASPVTTRAYVQVNRRRLRETVLAAAA